MPDSLHQRIREYAYMIWLNEGRPEGRDLEHWRTAEQRIRDYSEIPSDMVRADEIKPAETHDNAKPTKRSSQAKDLKEDPGLAAKGSTSRKSTGKRAVQKSPRK